jgi:hypothetical protein
MTAPPRRQNVPVGPLVAALGAILLTVSLFLDWYEGDIEAFTVYEFLDLVLVLMALLTVVSLAGGLGLIRPAPSPVISLLVALFTVAVVLSQILNDPPAVAFNEEIGKETGIWLALGGAVLMAAGSVLAFARISLSVEARRREPAAHPVDDSHPTQPLRDAEAAEPDSPPPPERPA